MSYLFCYPTNPIVNEREQTHGPFNKTAVMAQRLKTTIREGTNWGALSLPQKEAMENIASKMARILEGNHFCADHFDDIGGYAHLAKVYGNY